MDLIEVIQQIGQESYKGMKPTDLVFGTVVSTDPFRVQLESTMQPIPAAALVRTVGVMPKTYTGTTSEGDTFSVIINEGLSAGDRVVMLQCARGQRYLVLSKVY